MLMTSGLVHKYPDIFENASFLSALGYRPHGYGVVGHRKRSFSKMLSRVDLFENAAFLLSCRRMKMELFENADTTSSIYNPSEHALRFWGSREGILFICFRISNITAFLRGRG